MKCIFISIILIYLTKVMSIENCDELESLIEAHPNLELYSDGIQIVDRKKVITNNLYKISGINITSTKDQSNPNGLTFTATLTTYLNSYENYILRLGDVKKVTIICINDGKYLSINFSSGKSKQGSNNFYIALLNFHRDKQTANKSRLNKKKEYAKDPFLFKPEEEFEDQTSKFKSGASSEKDLGYTGKRSDVSTYKPRVIRNCNDLKDLINNQNHFYTDGLEEVTDGLSSFFVVNNLLEVSLVRHSTSEIDGYKFDVSVKSFNDNFNTELVSLEEQVVKCKYSDSRIFIIGSTKIPFSSIFNDKDSAEFNYERNIKKYTRKDQFVKQEYDKTIVARKHHHKNVEVSAFIPSGTSTDINSQVEPKIIKIETLSIKNCEEFKHLLDSKKTSETGEEKVADSSASNSESPTPKFVFYTDGKEIGERNSKNYLRKISFDDYSIRDDGDLIFMATVVFYNEVIEEKNQVTSLSPENVKVTCNTEDKKNNLLTVGSTKIPFSSIFENKDKAKASYDRYKFRDVF